MKKILSTLSVLFLTLAASAQCSVTANLSVTPGSGINSATITTSSSVTGTVPSTAFVQSRVYYTSGWANVPLAGTTNVTVSNCGSNTFLHEIRVIDSTSSGLVVLCSDSAMQTVTIPCAPCYTTISKVYGASGTGTITFTATTPAGTPGMTYNWNFGDGTTGTGNPVSHTYATGNTNYIITLTAASSSASCTYTATTNAQFGTINNPCTKTIGKSYGANGAVTYWVTPATPVMTYNWNFGDGSIGSGSPVTHTYAANGSYNVTLASSSSSAGCFDSSTTTAIVTNANSNKITGYITTDSTQPGNDSFKVWLIQKYIIMDSVTMTYDTFLVAVDSILAAGWSWGMAPYQFSNKPAGNYMVKAKLLGGPASGTGWVPTYHYSSLYWNTATSFFHAGGNTSGKNIQMQIGTITSGPGFVGGNVALGANKGTSSGIPEMLIFLRDANGNLISSTYTDANGNYSFSNITVGAYSVYPENMSYTTTPSTVVVSTTNPTANSVNFRQSDKMMTITPITTGIANVNANNGMAIYPNPANSQLFVATGNMDTKAMVIISNITGSKVMEAQVSLKNGIGELNISNLQAGQYFISVESGKGRMTQKLLIEK